jgi:predicted transcriptional regulator
MEDKNKKPVDKKELKKPTGKSATGKPLDGIEIRPQLKDLGQGQRNEDAVVLADTLAEKKALTLVQRQRRARAIRAKEPKMQRAKELAKHKLASDEKLKARAIVQARNIVKKRFASRRGTPYTELSTAEKIQVDTAVDKKVNLIKKLATRLLPRIRKMEFDRLASFNSGAPLKNLAPAAVSEDLNKIIESLNNKSPLHLVDIINESIYTLNEQNDSMAITLKRMLHAVLPEDSTTFTIMKKAERTGIPFSTLREVFERGVFAWDDEKVTQEQYAFSRVNSYIAKGKAWTLDADLREEKDVNDKLDNVFEAYHTGLSASTAKARESHWKKMEKYSDRDPRAYQDAPGDKAARKKDMPQSVHTKKYKAMYGEEIEQMVNEAADGLADKAKKSGVSLSTLKKVYARGVAAWNSGHRPGTTPQQWGMARVNSYITKGKGTYHGADKDLRESDINESLWANIHAKRKRIKAGSGERMRKPGSKGAPTAAGFRSAQEAVEDEVGNQIADTARHGKVRYGGVRTADHKETGTQERQEVQYMKRHRMHTKKETDADPLQIRIAQDQIKKKVIDESNNKPYVKPFTEKGSTQQRGWKASNKHGKVKYFGMDFKASAHKHAGINEAAEKHPIAKEYDSLKKHDIKTLHGLIKQQSKVVDTSEFKTKDHAISHYLRNKHGHKKVDAAFGFKEDTAADREVGTKSLVKKYQKETPGQEKADLNESFNIEFAAGIGVGLTANECGIFIKPGFEMHPSVVEEEKETKSDFRMVKVRTPKGWAWRKVRREVDIEKDAE